MILLISNDPLAPRQRLADPGKPTPTGPARFADADHRVVGRGRIADGGNGWIELEDVKELDPFIFRADDETVFAYRPGGPTRETADRPGQQRFRDRLMRAYGGRCAVTGCDVPELLDAAHLRPWRIGDEGVLLRTDLHRMIDRGLARIADGRFRLAQPAPAYLASRYGAYDGVKPRPPRKQGGYGRHPSKRSNPSS